MLDRRHGLEAVGWRFEVLTLAKNDRHRPLPIVRYKHVRRQRVGLNPVPKLTKQFVVARSCQGPAGSNRFVPVRTAGSTMLELVRSEQAKVANPGKLRLLLHLVSGKETQRRQTIGLA